MIDFLSREEVQTIIRSAISGEALSIRKKLEKKYSSEECIVIIQQIALKKKAAKKFPRYNEMLFDSEGLEQASSYSLSQYHSMLFSQNDILLDVCTGIGGDLAAFSRHVKKIYSIHWV